MLSDIIVAVLIDIITIVILRDIQVKEYIGTEIVNDKSEKVYNTYDIRKLPVYVYILIIIFSSIPILNISLFAIFCGIIMALVSCDSEYGKSYRLRGSYIITKCILYIIKILNFKV